MDLLSLADASLLLLQEPFVESTSQNDVLPPSSTSTSSSNQSSGPPPHRNPSPLDRVGGSGDPIGPRKRSRRGPAPRTPQQQARSVARRNARERKRVRLVNLGFATLRDHIPPHFGTPSTPPPKSKLPKPSSSNSKKLSKVETLRYAIEYIKQLREAIGMDDKDNGGTSEGFSSSSSPPDLSSSPSYCTTPSPVAMLMSAASPPMFQDDDDDFLDIDWTTL